ncbi:MAG: hypothetical protein JW908_13490 [Anaerolineales bacterium]|nr:hypothetical protein [Anaerolineales bacterium]
MDDIEWLLFTTQLPATPSSLRVNVWRKLSDWGAANLQSGIWILPFSDDHRLFLERLLVYIKQNMASGQIFVVKDLNEEIYNDILARFESSRDQEYGEFLEQCELFLAELQKETNQQKFTFAELEENEQNLLRLRKWIAKIQKRDFFKSKNSTLAVDTFQKCRHNLQVFTHHVLTKEGIEIKPGIDILSDETNL